MGFEVRNDSAGAGIERTQFGPEGERGQPAFGWRFEIVVGVVAALVVGSLSLATHLKPASAVIGTVSTVAVRTSPIGSPLTSLATTHYIGRDTSGSLYLGAGTTYGIIKSTVGGTTSSVAPEWNYNRVGPDGLLYAGSGAQIVRRNNDLSTTVVAGTGVAGWSGDSGPASAAQISGFPVFGSSGAIFVVGVSRIRRISTAGTISTMAGTGTVGDAGDGGAASSAQIDADQAALDGSERIVFAQKRPSNGVSSKVRRLEADGTITTRYAAPADRYITSLAAAPDGSIYFVLGQTSGPSFLPGRPIFEIRRIAPDGGVSVVAGTGMAGTSPDGTRALGHPIGSLDMKVLDVLGDGSVLFEEDDFAYLDRKVSVKRGFSLGGSLQTVTGAGPILLKATTPRVIGLGANKLVTSAFMEASGSSPVSLVPRAVGAMARMPNGAVDLYESSGTGPAFVVTRRVIASDGTETATTAPFAPQRPAYGANGTLYYFDGSPGAESDCRILARTTGGGTSVFAGGPCGPNSLDRNGPLAVGPDDAVYNAAFVHPDVNIYFGVVFRVPGGAGVTTRFAGKDAGCSSTDGVQATEACVYADSLLFDSNGNLLFVDGQSRVRKIATNGIISTIADGIGGASAPVGDLAFDASGNLYVGVQDAVRRIEGAGPVWSVPRVPRSVAGVVNGADVSVSWLAPSSDGGQPLLDYTVVVSPGGASVTVPRGSTSAVVPGLSRGVAYTYAVTARNSMGISSAGSSSPETLPTH
jgi:Fibronectin type III domain